MKFSPLTEDALIKSLNTRCPTCNMAWWLFPPAKIDGEEKVRCVECKDVFDAFMAVDVLDQPGH